MTARMDRTASGARHHRWGGEVLATINAHIEENGTLSEEQLALLVAELASGQALHANLGAAVDAYRRWLSTGRVGIRASLRVANFLLDQQQVATESALRPHRKALADVLPGGIATIFSKLPLSRVLRAGNVRAAKIARTGASVIATVSGTGGLPVLTPLAEGLDAGAARLELLVKKLDEEIEPQRLPLKHAVERAVLELREGFARMDARLRDKFTADFIESLYPELARGSRAVRDEDDADDDDSEGEDET